MKLNATQEQLSNLYQKYQLELIHLPELSLEISIHDTMYEGNIAWGDFHYAKVGIEAVSIIKYCFLLKHTSNPEKILDFGCGYGRVLRFLKNQYPDASITACEIAEDSVGFCSETFGVYSYLSNADVKYLPKESKYDLIWAGSVFTHLSNKHFKELFNYFMGILNTNGMLVFSTHGRFCELHLRGDGYGLNRWQQHKVYWEYRLLGFGYEDYPGKNGYGVSINTPAWLMDFLSDYTEIEIVGYFEKYWDEHQDIVAIQKK